MLMLMLNRLNLNFITSYKKAGKPKQKYNRFCFSNDNLKLNKSFTKSRYKMPSKSNKDFQL